MWLKFCAFQTWLRQSEVIIRTRNRSWDSATCFRVTLINSHVAGDIKTHRAWATAIFKESRYPKATPEQHMLRHWFRESRFSECACGRWSVRFKIARIDLKSYYSSRDICDMSPGAGPGILKRVGRGYCLPVFSYSIQLSVDRWQVETGDSGHYDSLHAIRPEASAD